MFILKTLQEENVHNNCLMGLKVWWSWGSRKKKIKITAGRTVFRKSTPNFKNVPPVSTLITPYEIRTISNADFGSWKLEIWKSLIGLSRVTPQIETIATALGRRAPDVSLWVRVKVKWMMMIHFWSFIFRETNIYYRPCIYLKRYKRKMCTTILLWV